MSDTATLIDATERASSAPASEGERRTRLIGGLERGLPNQWFPILRASQLRDLPVRVRRFGEELTLWRDSAGHPRVFQDRCPHRGASLSLGTIHGDSLSCRYHGWTYDRTGACIQVSLGEALGDKLANLKGRAGLKTYAAEDRAGYIWAFYGDPGEATPLDSAPYELEDPRWSVFRQEYVWNTNWLNILDNVLDPLHALFVHAGVATQLRRAKLERFEVSEDFEEGFRLAKKGVLVNGVAGEEAPVEFRLPATFRLDLADGTRQGLMRVVMIPTPVDEHSTFLCYIQARRVSGLARLWWHILWWTKFRRAQDLIKQQDRQLLGSLGPIREVREQENLSPSDVGVIHLRRRLNQAFARVQASNSAEAQSSRAKRPQQPFAAWEVDSGKPAAGPVQDGHPA